MLAVKPVVSKSSGNVNKEPSGYFSDAGIVVPLVKAAKRD